MKKVLGIIIACCALVGVIFGFYHIINNNKLTTYDEIDYNEYTKLIEEKQDFILYVGSANCSHCQEFTPTLKQFIKDYNVDIKYIDISKLDDKQYSVLKNKTKVSGTPTIVIFKEGIVESGSINKLQGAVGYDKVETFFREKKLID